MRGEPSLEQTANPRRRGAVFLPSSPFPFSGERVRDADFLRELASIDPALPSRKKAKRLRDALHWTRELVYTTAKGLGISLAKCGSHAEMAAPPRRLRLRDLDLDDIFDRLMSRYSTMAEIADEYGICPRTLQRFMREAGIDTRHDIGWPDEDVANAILELREEPGFGDTGVAFTHGACASQRRPRCGGGIPSPFPSPSALPFPPPPPPPLTGTLPH